MSIACVTSVLEPISTKEGKLSGILMFYPLSKTNFNSIWRQRKFSADVTHTTANVYGFVRGNDLNLLLHFTFNIVVILKLPLEPSLRNKMHTAVTGKCIFFFF